MQGSPCPYCYSLLADGARFCNECGREVPVNSKATLIGALSPTVVPPSASAPPKPPQAAPIGAQMPRKAAQTMLGLPPLPDALPGSPPHWPPNPTGAIPPSNPEPPQSPPRHGSFGKQTLVGFAAPAVPSQPGVPPPGDRSPFAPQTPAQPAPSAPVTPAPPPRAKAATLLGVAMPGIAPNYDNPPPLAMAPEPALSPMPPRTPSWIRATAITLLAVAILAALFAVYLVVRPQRAPVLSARLEADKTSTKLRVQCANCEAGTSITVLGKSVTLAANEALFELPANEIVAGDNRLVAHVKRRNDEREVELHVDLPYKVQLSHDPLSRAESTITMIFDVAPDVATLEVDGQAIAVNGRKYEHQIAIPAPKVDSARFESTVSFKVLRKSGATASGSLQIRVPYAPLELGLPGAKPVVWPDADKRVHVIITGRTSPKIKVVRVGKDEITPVDGIFRADYVLATADERAFSVTAFGDAFAPRTAQITLESVYPDAQTAIAKVSALAKPLAQLAPAIDKFIGQWVDAKVVVALTSETNGRIQIAGHVACDVEPCPDVVAWLPAIANRPESKANLHLLGVVLGRRNTAIEIDSNLIVP